MKTKRSLNNLKKDLYDWSVKNADKIGFQQEWEYFFLIRQDEKDYIYTIDILEADEHHILTGASGRTVEDAIEQLYLRIPMGFHSWGWPTQFPIIETAVEEWKYYG